MQRAGACNTAFLAAQGSEVGHGAGGSHLGLAHVDEQLSLRIVRHAIDEGITFLDNAWDYNAGASEIRVGKALRDGYRDKVFLMTKIDGRSKREAERQLDESLRRLQTDHIDLVQHHEVIRFDDPHRVFDEEGSNETLIEARRAGKLRYIGFTGHKDPQIHLHMLEVAAEHGFDSIRTVPLNVMDAHYRSFGKLVLPELVKRGIGVLGMKSMGNGIIEIEYRYRGGVSPVSGEPADIGRHHRLRQHAGAGTSARGGETFRPMTEPEVDALFAKTRPAAERGEFELFKTTSILDSTATNPAWLGEEPQRVRNMMQA